MTSLLDLVAENTQARTSGPVILHEEHDVQNIQIAEADILNGLRDAAGVWDAAEMGISREEVARRIAAADTPEARASIVADVRARAIRRFGMDTTAEGKIALFTVGYSWNRLGVTLENAIGSADALKLSRTDYTVEKRPVRYTHEGRDITAEDVYALVRTDTGKHLATVGARYTPIQNAEAFQHLDSVLADFGARYESAGAMQEGGIAFMCAQMPRQAFPLLGDDWQVPYVLFTNVHDGSGCSTVAGIMARPECANTHRIALRDASATVKLRHTGSITQKVRQTQEVMGLTARAVDEYRPIAEAMTRTALPDPIPYFDGLLDLVADVTAADARLGVSGLVERMAIKDAAERELAAKRIGKQIAHRRGLLEEIVETYHAPTNTRHGQAGTVYAAFQAATEFDPQPRRKVGSTRERMERNFAAETIGAGNVLKEAALTAARALIA